LQGRPQQWQDDEEGEGKGEGWDECRVDTAKSR